MNCMSKKKNLNKSVTEQGKQICTECLDNIAWWNFPYEIHEKNLRPGHCTHSNFKVDFVAVQYLEFIK